MGLVSSSPPKTQAEALSFWLSVIAPFTYLPATYTCGIRFRPPNTEDMPQWRRCYWRMGRRPL